MEALTQAQDLVETLSAANDELKAHRDAQVGRARPPGGLECHAC